MRINRVWSATSSTTFSSRSRTSPKRRVGSSSTAASPTRSWRTLVCEGDLGDKVERSLRRGRGMAGVGPMVMPSSRQRLEAGRLGARSRSGSDQGSDRHARRLAARPDDGQASSRRGGRVRGPAAARRVGLRVATPKLETPRHRASSRRSSGRRSFRSVRPSPRSRAPVQAKVCRMLSNIGWPTAIPTLLDVASARGPPPR